MWFLKLLILGNRSRPTDGDGSGRRRLGGVWLFILPPRRLVLFAVKALEFLGSVMLALKNLTAGRPKVSIDVKNPCQAALTVRKATSMHISDSTSGLKNPKSGGD